MKAVALIRRRVALGTDAFAEIAIWRVPSPVPPSTHLFKYRMACVVADEQPAIRVAAQVSSAIRWERFVMSCLSMDAYGCTRGATVAAESLCHEPGAGALA